jgi:hypothetical protein
LPATLAVLIVGTLGSGAAPPPAPALTAEAAAALVATVRPRVEEIRGLRFKRPVSVKVVDDRTARAHFLARARKEYPEDKLHADQAVYAHLGLVPPGTDLLGTLLDLLEEQVGGYYDPDTDTFFVLDDLPASVAPVIAAHELTHALDDQHYGIDGILAGMRDDDDRAAAFAAVVEGSGTLVMTTFLLQETQAGRLKPDVMAELQQTEMGRGERLKKAPPFVQRSLLAPYVLGLPFVLRGSLLQILTFRAADIDRAFASPPASTEQLLHPDKYWSETAREVTRPQALPDLSAAVGAGFRLLGQGTLGELGLAVLVGAGVPDVTTTVAVAPDAWTSPAAAGVAGDVYHHYVRGKEAVTVLATAWDTAEDAEEFEKALPAHAGRLVLRRGRLLALVAGDLGEGARDLAAAALDALSRAAS